jgi:hypothetical protein
VPDVNVRLPLGRSAQRGVLRRRAYSSRPPRYEYLLTKKGYEFCEILLAITAWGDRWTADESGPPVLIRHRECEQHTRAEVRCAQCGKPLHGDAVAIEPGPGARQSA